MPTVKYTILQETDEYILIQDECMLYGCMSVTNGAEMVVEQLYRGPLQMHQKLFYVDTDGRVDELLHHNSKFKGFKSGYPSLNSFLHSKRKN